VPKCVIFDVRSIFEVQVVSENFSLYMFLVGLMWHVFDRQTDGETAFLLLDRVYLVCSALKTVHCVSL